MKDGVFLILFCISVILLILIFISNWLSNNKGTYTDYSSMIKDLWNKKFIGTSTQSTDNKSFESKGEKECRRVIEKYTGMSFPKQRPNFLRNNISGSNLELDCFNDHLKIAVEYNGEQHYKYTPYFHSSKEAFYNLKYKDDIKKRLCRENGIHLIVVPYTVSFSDIENYVVGKLHNCEL